MSSPLAHAECRRSGNTGCLACRGTGIVDCPHPERYGGKDGDGNEADVCFSCGEVRLAGKNVGYVRPPHNYMGAGSVVAAALSGSRLWWGMTMVAGVDG